MTKEELNQEDKKIELQRRWDRLSREDLIIAYKVMADECNRLHDENNRLKGVDMFGITIEESRG